MTVRLAFLLLTHHTQVDLTAHPIFKGGAMGERPSYTHVISPEIEHGVIIHEGVGLVLHKGSAPRVEVDLSHCDPEIPRWLEITFLVVHQVGAAVELGRERLRPGDETRLTLVNADVAVIRELPYGIEGLEE